MILGAFLYHYLIVILYLLNSITAIAFTKPYITNEDECVYFLDLRFSLIENNEDI